MNRKERRELEKENKRRERLKKTQEYKTMKAIDDKFKGSGTDVELMKSLLLAYEPNPEPIQILFVRKDNDLFEQFANEKFCPIFCYLQEKDGTFSKIKANGIDHTQSIKDIEFGTRKDFELNGLENPTQEITNIETIKVLNSVYESQGGGLMDVVHYVFTDHSLDQIFEQSMEMERYFGQAYQGMRNILVKAIAYQDPITSNLKVG